MNSDVANLQQWGDNPKWYDKINISELEKLAAIGYTPIQIAKYFNIPWKDFEWYFNLIGSPIKYHYERGQLYQQAKEGIAMAAAAETGENVTQAQRLDKLRRKVEFNNSLQRIVFGDIE